MRQAALLQSGELLVGSTRDAHHEIKPILQTFLKQEWHLDRPMLPRPPGKLLPPD